MDRRGFLRSLAILAAIPGTSTAATEFAPVRRNVRLAFPFDHGAHPDFRSEWWYVTGWLTLPGGARLGFQSTFFRVRTGIGEDNPSAFAPHQLIIAHAAIADPRRGRLRVDQKAARTGFKRAGFASGRTEVWLDNWRLAQRDDRYQIEVRGDQFAYSLALVPDGPPLLNGLGGFSTKAPDPRHASHYYSRPQLAVSGSVSLEGDTQSVSGRAWLDHEWSSELLPADAQGWDWIGVNLDGGGALMAFRLRRPDGSALWSAATVREAGGPARSLGFDAVSFAAGRTWRSPRTGISYPVEWAIRVGTSSLQLQPLFDDQELDSRATTGSVYWEGAVVLRENGLEVGRGYLEMTGYGDRIRVG